MLYLEMHYTLAIICIYTYSQRYGQLQLLFVQSINIMYRTKNVKWKFLYPEYRFNRV